jgi:L,D-transpeptidase YcbB
MLVLVTALVDTGCQRNLTHTLSATVVESPAAETIIATDEKPYTIDTLRYSIHTRLSSIIASSSYFDKRVRAKSTEFYSRNDFQTKWLGQHAPTALYYALIDLLQNSGIYGLHPGDYPAYAMDERIQLCYNQPNAETEIFDLDAQLTDAFFLFTTHLIEGRIKKTNSGNRLWIKATSKSDDIATLLAIHDPSSLQEKVAALHPEQEQYAKLLQALELYRALERSIPNDLPVLYTLLKISPNDVNEIIPLIRRRLERTDWEFDSLMIDSLRYDEVLVAAVKWFQVRHGLEADGIIGLATLKFLNQPYKEKIEVIELNLERMRWVPESYGHNYIIVNVPEYKLRVFESAKQVLEMKVIVGAESTATPIFNDTLLYIVFSPTWNVPNSIIRDEIILRLQKDSTYYVGKNYTFFKRGVALNPASVNWNNPLINSRHYSVVQLPGKTNSLGLVKFILPNKMSIYLHDTPNHRLFNKTNRALSHGCVRLADPDKLAEYLLKDKIGWRMENIDKAMNSHQPRTVFLTIPYPIHIEYRTAWVDDNGLVNFREDIYGHDKLQLAQLKSVDQKAAMNQD